MSAAMAEGMAFFLRISGSAAILAAWSDDKTCLMNAVPRATKYSRQDDGAPSGAPARGRFHGVGRLLLSLSLFFVFSTVHAENVPTKSKRVRSMTNSAFIQNVPQECQQIVLVRSPNVMAVTAEMTFLERAGQEWKTVAGPFSVTLGRQGLAWGRGEHAEKAPSGWRIKREGDDCAPAGVFLLPFAFGESSAEKAKWLRLRYLQMTPTFAGVDDSQSRYYNQIVDASKVKPDWQGAEKMILSDGTYRWGLYVSHNADAKPQAGSCIFMHLWKGPGIGTAGCTAMSAETMEKLLRWLDADAKPRLVQGL